LKRQQARTGLQNKWVFVDHKNSNWTHTVFALAFNFQMRLAGLIPRTPKELRHTFATLNIGAGEDITWLFASE